MMAKLLFMVSHKRLKNPFCLIVGKNLREDMSKTRGETRAFFLLSLPYLDTMETTRRFEMLTRAYVVGCLSLKSVEWKN
jgi:hypothetical protein